MDQLDQALERAERDLYNALESITDPRIKTLLSDIKNLRGAKEVLRRQATPTFAIDPNPKLPTNGHNHAVPITQGDAAFKILQYGPLHISQILAELPNYGITTASKVNLSSILVKDRRKRFVNKGKATFALSSNARGVAGQKQRPLPGLPQGFSLTESIKALLPELRGEFGQPDVYKMLRDRHPEAADRIQKASISTTLSKLVERDLIEITKIGHGSEPRQYRTRG